MYLVHMLHMQTYKPTRGTAKEGATGELSRISVRIYHMKRIRALQRYMYTYTRIATPQTMSAAIMIEVGSKVGDAIGVEVWQQRRRWLSQAEGLRLTDQCRGA